MDIVLIPFLQILNLVIDIYIWVLIISIIMHWLFMFNVLNIHHHFTRRIYQFLRQLTEPVLRKISRIIKPINGIDLSPFILILILYFIQGVLYKIAAKI